MGFRAIRTDIETPSVENQVCLPPPRAGNRWKRKYPWLELRVGDSFLVQKEQQKFGNSVWNAEQRYGIKLSTRAVHIHGVPHTRVWRIK